MLPALGVDDTRMDLSQFDDAQGTGRSVPTTPSARTPPTINVVEASPPHPSPSATPSDTTSTQDTEQAGEGSNAGDQQAEVELAAGGDGAREQAKPLTGT